jgi:hypothetical protein
MRPSLGQCVWVVRMSISYSLSPESAQNRHELLSELVRPHARVRSLGKLHIMQKTLVAFFIVRGFDIALCVCIICVMLRCVSCGRARTVFVVLRRTMALSTSQPLAVCYLGWGCRVRYSSPCSRTLAMAKSTTAGFG